METLLLTINDAATALSVSTRTVERLIATGSLPRIKLGTATRVPADAVRALATTGATPVAPAARCSTVIPLPRSMR